MTTQSATAAREDARTPMPTVLVRERAPLLPKIAFVLIGLASLLGTALSNRGLGVPLVWLVPRWLALWAAAASVGFLAWRVGYLRDEGVDGLVGYHADLRRRARIIGRIVGPLVVVTVPTVTAAGYLERRGSIRASLLLAAVVLAGLLFAGIDRRSRAWGALVAAAGLTLTWAVADAGTGLAAVWRALHLVAFGLWMGGAAWNLAVAIPVGTRHPTVDAVISGARQLQRFRRVARVALPTIVVTGIAMALPHLSSVAGLAGTTTGRFISAKVGLVLVLVAIFITCPLFRQCSPVAGVCDLDELDEPGPHRSAEEPS